MLVSQGLLANTRGIARTSDDQARGAVIEGLLCQGRARLGRRLLSEVSAALGPFIARGLARIEGVELMISPAGLPYARTLAALFDPYRQASATSFLLGIGTDSCREIVGKNV